MKRLTTPFLALVAIALMVVGAQAAWNIQQKPDGSTVWRNALSPSGGGLQEWPVGRVVLTFPVSQINGGISEFVVSPITGVIKAAWIAVKSVASATIHLQMLYESLTNGTFTALAPTWAVNATQSAGYSSGLGEGSVQGFSTTHTVRQYRPIAISSQATAANGNTRVDGIVTVIIDPY